MPITTAPRSAAPTSDALRIVTGCHLPTHMACLRALPKGGDILALGETGPWMEDAERLGAIATPIDLLAPDAADRLAMRLTDACVQVIHPLVAIPTNETLRSTSALLVALGRSHACVERFVLGGSACVWRKRAHRWSVGDDTPLPPALSARAAAYGVAERLCMAALGPSLVRLRAAPIWDAPERGLKARLHARRIPEPKGGRALLDPLMLDDFARATAAALAANGRANGGVFGLPGPHARKAKDLAAAAEARVFSTPTHLSEALGALGLFGWDRDTALVMAWSLTLSGSGARAVLGWDATTPVPLAG